MLDILVAGGGPAGLSAALVLGRARRHVLVCDAGRPRNARVPEIRGFLSRDGMNPAELHRIALEQLAPYPSVRVMAGEVASVDRVENGFAVRLADGEVHQARKLLVATGVVDELPEIEGLAALWGRSAFNCPYCDGWEMRDRPLAVLGGAASLLLALQLSNWSDNLVFCTNGATDIDDYALKSLGARGIRVRDEPVTRMHGGGGQLQAIEFADGSRLDRDAVFLHPETRQGSDLPRQLGCETLDDGSVSINEFAQTSVPGVYAAGDLARRPGLPFAAAQVVLAAGAGVVAAVAMNVELLGGDIGAAIAAQA